jgi:ribosomal protein S18 acetylase RimI-like enzyme
VPAEPPPAPLELEPAGPEAASLLKFTYVRIGEPHGWTGRTGWSDEQWAEELARPNVQAWVARVGGQVAGFVELDVENGDAGIVVLGLVPEFIGRGFGGALLTEATRLAWRLTPPGGGTIRRVRVETSSGDHPHALPNYEARGFRTFRSEPA